MLDNSIVLSVDLLNTGVTTDVTFSRFDELVNRSVYKSELDSYVLRDQLNVYRTLPKRAGNSLGVKKSAFKLTMDQEVSGVDSTTTLIAPAIADISFNIPVGTTPAVTEIMRQRIIALLDHAFAKRVVDDLEY